jgi:hypothetical protein
LRYVLNKFLILQMLLLSAVTAEADTPAAQGIHMHSVDIIDNQGFGQRLIAGRFMAPVGWTAQGFAAWPGKKIVPCKPTPTMIFQAISPEKTTGVQVFAGETWLSSPNPQFAQQLQIQQNSTHVVTHCEVRPLVSAVDYLKTLISREKSIDVISSGPMPDGNTLARMIGSGNGQGRVSVDTARLYLHGTSEGVATEGYTETAVITTTTQTPLGLIVQVSIPIVVNKFAPIGTLKQTDKLLSAIANNVSVNPDWQRRVDEFQSGLHRIQQNINADDANTARNIARIQQGANDYAYNVIRGAQRNSQRGIDSSAHAFALSMNDTQEYHDAATGQTVLGSNQYNHVYSNGQGEYIYSDSATYDPNATQRGSWQEMKPQQ